MVGDTGCWRRGWLETRVVGEAGGWPVGVVDGWSGGWFMVRLVGTYPDLGLWEPRVIGGTCGWHLC